MMIVPPPDYCGKNKKAGKCTMCGKLVPAGAGELYRGAAGWMVSRAGDPGPGSECFEYRNGPNGDAHLTPAERTMRYLKGGR